MRTLLLAGSLLALSCSAQHCGYDFASVIVVRPHAEGDTTVIEGLRITLLDSTGIPWVQGRHPWYHFLPNTDLEACNRWQGDFFPGHRVCFPFAKDGYVLVIPRGLDTGRMKVLVQDERPRTKADQRHRNWPTRFTQQVVPLSSFDNYSLCGTFNDAVYPELRDRPPYHAVDITLLMR